MTEGNRVCSQPGEAPAITPGPASLSILPIASSTGVQEGAEGTHQSPHIPAVGFPGSLSQRYVPSRRFCEGRSLRKGVGAAPGAAERAALSAAPSHLQPLSPAPPAPFPLSSCSLMPVALNGIFPPRCIRLEKQLNLFFGHLGTSRGASFPEDVTHDREAPVVTKPTPGGPENLRTATKPPRGRFVWGLFRSEAAACGCDLRERTTLNRLLSKTAGVALYSQLEFQILVQIPVCNT